jgi:hypothetical protein
MLRPTGSAPATAYFDDVRWQKVDPPTLLYAGWNPIELAVSSCSEPSSAFAGIIEKLAVAWLFVGQTQSWKGYDPKVPPTLNTLSQVCGGDILWLFLSEDASWWQPD